MSIDVWVNLRHRRTAIEQIFEIEETIRFYRKHLLKTFGFMVGLGAIPFMFINSIVASCIITAFILIFMVMLSILTMPTRGIYSSYTHALLERGPWVIMRPVIIPHDVISLTDSREICDGINPNNYVQISNHIHLFRSEKDAVIFKLGMGRVNANV